MAGEVEIKIDPRQWAKVSADLKRFDPALQLALRRSIREIGKRAVDKVKEGLRETVGVSNDVGSRAALIRGTSTRVSFAIRGAGVKIVTSGRALSKGHDGFEHVWNMTNFRHPVFGTDSWVQQAGRPYFGVVIKKYADRAMLEEIALAVTEAEHAIGARGL